MMARRYPVRSALVGAVAMLLAVIAVGSATLSLVMADKNRQYEQQAVAARKAQLETEHAMAETLLARATATRSSFRSGRHFDQVESIRKALDIAPKPISDELRSKLRNEAIAGMTIHDFRIRNRVSIPPLDERSVRFSPNLERCAFVAEDGSIVAFDLDRPLDQLVLSIDSGPPLQIEFAGPTQVAALLATRANGAVIKSCSLKTPSLAAESIAEFDELPLAFDARATQAAIAWVTNAGELTIQRLPSDVGPGSTEMFDLDDEIEHVAEIRGIRLSHAGDRIAIVNRSNVLIYDTASSKVLRTLRHPERSTIRCAAWSENGRTVSCRHQYSRVIRLGLEGRVDPGQGVAGPRGTSCRSPIYR